MEFKGCDLESCYPCNEGGNLIDIVSSPTITEAAYDADLLYDLMDDLSDTKSSLLIDCPGFRHVLRSMLTQSLRELICSILQSVFVSNDLLDRVFFRKFFQRIPDSSLCSALL